MIESLEDFKNLSDSVRSQIDRGKEPVEELQVLYNKIKDISEDPTSFHQKYDKDYKRFFFEDFTSGLIKRLTRERSRDNKYLEVISQILESYLKLSIVELKQERYNHAFFDSIKLIFDFDSILHNQNYQIPEEQLKAIRSKNQPWRAELKEGDMVDCINEEIMRASGWSQARIESVSQDILRIEFINDYKSSDRYLDRWSVEIAEFKTKTKEIFDWKDQLAKGALIDAHDKSCWNKSTVLDFKEENIGQRTIKLVYVAYRVYMEKGPKIDDDGRRFDGWSSKFDEYIPLYSPRIQPFHSKSQKGNIDEYDIDEDLDNIFQPEEGFSKVYAVPRTRKCTSSAFIHHMNFFGHHEGFETYIDCLSKGYVPDNDDLSLSFYSILIECLSKPYLIYHSKFQREFSPKVVEIAKSMIKNAPEKFLRDVKRERIEQIIKSIDCLQRRNQNRDTREKDTTTLKLEVCLICLKSNYLERRIQGIRDLNQLIRNNGMSFQKGLSNQQLIEWLIENEVIGLIFDAKKTHLQIVQRSGEILKLLLQEDQMSKELLEQFWSLSKSEYKFEVYKIFNDISYYLSQDHKDVIFTQIENIPPEKLGIEEFGVLSDLGKYGRDDQLKLKISDFFWRIICESESYKEELVSTCIGRFCEMVILWPISKKIKFLVSLTENIKQNKSSISSIRLFKQLLKDEWQMQHQSTRNIQQYPQSSSFDPQIQEVEPQITIEQTIEQLLANNNLIQNCLSNLDAYYQKFNQLFNPSVHQNKRNKLYVLNQRYSHHEEVDERLQFIKYIASISEFKISKSELDVIYRLLAQNSKIQSDQEEFLTWCKHSCEQSSLLTVILDLNEVGEFFTQKMNSKELDVENLLMVGFEFLQHYFLSVNEKEQKLQKSSKPKRDQKLVEMKSHFKKKKLKQSEEAEDTSPIFQILTPINALSQLQIVWNMALYCKEQRVAQSAINFLIKVYTCVEPEQVLQVQDELIQKCMDILKDSNDEFQIKRVLDILKNIIYEAEKKGTGDVQPHNAVLKGEFLDTIFVKNKASSTKGNLVFSVYSNLTIWELKKEVALQLDLSPKYLFLEKSDGTQILDKDNGKTLAQLQIHNREILHAYKNLIEEEVAHAPLIGKNGKLLDKPLQIFNEWFDMYSNSQDQMTHDTCGLFVRGCTGEIPTQNDDRILNLFKAYDSNNDGIIERTDFLRFYEDAAKMKPDTVRENLKAHNIRNDLKKLSEIQEQSSYTKEDMPRYKISKNQEYFDLLVKILERPDSASQESWDLIQMLATNNGIYTRVLELKSVSKENESTNEIDWEKFFDSESIYKLLYTLQIIEAVMEDDENSSKRIQLLKEEEQYKVIPQAPPLPGQMPMSQAETDQKQKLSQKIEEIKTNDDTQDQKLRTGWTEMFLKNKGFEYILKVFLNKEIQTKTSGESLNFTQVFELKHVAFLLKLLKIFIMAAFININDEQKNEQVVHLIKRTSQNAQIEDKNQGKITKEEGTQKFQELQKILDGDLGKQIIQNIDSKQLQLKILQVISQILSKQDLIYEDKLIIENALSLWLGCIIHKNELVQEFYEFKLQLQDEQRTCDDIILSGLLFCSYERIREEFKQILLSLSQNLQNLENPPLLYLLRLLSDKFSLINKYQSKQYFELFCQLIEAYFSLKNDENNSLKNETLQVFDPQSLLSMIIDCIKNYNQSLNEKTEEIQEKQTEDDVEEQKISESESMYIGLLQITGLIIENFDISFCEKIIEQKNLINELFTKFLFASVYKEAQNNGQDTIKIKTKSLQRKKKGGKQFGKYSKSVAYKLLNSLIRKSPHLLNQFLSKQMIPLMNQIRRIDGFNYTPPGSSDTQQQYVGLRNLGCICYMNSMLQQFFMIPTFRYNMLTVDDKLQQELVEYKGNQIDDNVLHQLQKLLAHLELSERTEYNPFEFCFAFKDLEGNPTNIGEQKDAQEFLNMIFGRVENLLRPTSRKYLLQSIFGIQTCSQIICNECGKVKNRIEDDYNLSLTVKDIKTMYDSIQKMVDGEIINDYSCEGCNKKVDISKRTLISSTPNVLIVHLQRIIFNFDTFRNDKINNYFEFPYQLDLTPYSFYDVMGKENRLNKKEGEDEDQEEQKEEEQKKDEDNVWPQEEDCFEYKLVGATVHSGSANAGHYWSYINIKRGFMEAAEDDPYWKSTETDPWMEFNDSMVRNFNFEKLKEECYGGDKTSDSSSFSFGGSYGKSAYMLVYERKKKKPLKILVDKEQVDKEKLEKGDIKYDSNQEEYYQLLDYREGVEDLQPNSIYKQVFDDNKKFEFENDIYAEEFFNFIQGILFTANELKIPENKELELEVKKASIQIGKKALFDILCKCFYNYGIKETGQIFQNLVTSNPQFAKDFLQQAEAEDGFEYLYHLLLECPGSQDRAIIAQILKVILNYQKLQEKEILYEFEKIETTTADGEIEIQNRPLAISARFIEFGLKLLNGFIAKNWSRFEQYFDLLYCFALGISDENEKPDQEITNLGIKFLLKQQIVQRGCDFLLGKKSPLCQIGEKRYEMGGSFSSPNYSSLINLISYIVQNDELLTQIPLNQIEKEMIIKNELLKIMLGSSNASKSYGKCLASMCKNNFKLSKKVSKVFISSINSSNYESVKNYLKALKPFLKMEDSLKAQKLEWVLGVSQIQAKKGFREERFKYPLENIDKINDDISIYVSPILCNSIDDGLLYQLIKCKGRLDTFAINCLKELLSLMAKDDMIARFVYRQYPINYSYIRYTDWIKPYLEMQKADIERSNATTYQKQKYDTLTKSLELFGKYEEKLDKLMKEDEELFKTLKEDGYFQDIEEDWLVNNPEVLPHKIPQVIVGKQVGEETPYMVFDDNQFVTVTLYEVHNQYNYSNPTALFNLSIPHVLVRLQNFSVISYQQYKSKQFQADRQMRREQQQESGEEQQVSATQDEEVEPEWQTLNWFNRVKEAPLFLKVVLTNKSKQKVKVGVQFKLSEGFQNIQIPLSTFKETLIETDSKCIAHFMKVDPQKGWGTFQVQLDVQEYKSSVPPPAPNLNYISKPTSEGCHLQ